MPEQLNYDVFISYRRLGAEVHARLLFEVLKDHYNVFLDNESLTTGKFEEIIHTAIRGCRDVIVILSHDSLERCNVPGDHYFKGSDKNGNSAFYKGFRYAHECRAFEIPARDKRASFDERSAL